MEHADPVWVVATLAPERLSSVARCPGSLAPVIHLYVAAEGAKTCGAICASHGLKARRQGIFGGSMTLGAKACTGTCLWSEKEPEILIARCSGDCAIYRRPTQSV